MPSYAHSKIAEQVANLDSPPSDPAAFGQWVMADQHLRFLQANANADEIIVFCSGPYTFIHSIVVPNTLLHSATNEDLLHWSCNPYTSIASYVYGGGREEMWIERGNSSRGSKVLNEGRDLVFARTFEGWPKDGRTYFELNQEYSHLAGIHWRPEHGAHCRFDDHGDIENVVSMTFRNEDSEVSLVTFMWQDLENYLTVSDTSLVRFFDFTLLRRDSFNGWPEGPESLVEVTDQFKYRQKEGPDSAYTRGYQIIGSRRAALDVMADIKNGWSGRRNKQFVEFLAQDWRNNKLAKISTDPKATTNYFEADKNNLPFELSPAFFRPEVLSKYKTDREKYKVSDRDVACRAAWHLRGYDVNDAGQIHAYICDLRNLPYSEQLHWLSYNEAPKTVISERAYVNDFKGEFVDFMHPRNAILAILQRWRNRKVEWWTLRDSDLLDRANPPLTTSIDEWGEAMMDLAKLVVEGFEVKAIREVLDTVKCTYDGKDQSIVLLENLIFHESQNVNLTQLSGLRTAQRVRSKVKGHSGSSEGKKIAHEALQTHGTYGAHFTHVCKLIAEELERIEQTIEDVD